MSLIKCRECGKKISSLANQCPRCGAPIESSEIISNDENSVDLSQAESGGSKVKKNITKRKIVVIAIIVVVVIAAIVVGLIVHNKMVKDAAKSQYSQGLNDYASEAIVLGTTCENMGNLTNKVWRNSIYKESDKTTDKYTKNSKGVFYDDFNDALSEWMFSKKCSKMKANALAQKTKIDEIYKKIQDSSEYVDDSQKKRDEMDALKELRNEVETFYKITTAPTGSLDTFSESFSTSDEAFLAKYNALMSLIK